MPDVDPEQILRQIEAELALSKTAPGDGNRNAFRIWSLTVLIVGTFAALWALQFLLSQMPRPQRTEPATVNTAR